MFLLDRLQICLLALESRCPENIVELNSRVLGPHAFCQDCWTAAETIELLQQTRPQLLGAIAHLKIDAQKCEIDLAGPDKDVPLLWIHCRGKIPVHTGNIDAWRK